jgi:outer membrane protein assembly factor BamA
MMNKSLTKNLLILLLCLFAGAGWSALAKKPAVKSIEIFGVKQVPESEVKKWLTIKVGDAFDTDLVYKDCQQVIAQYAERGYPYAAVDSAVYHISADCAEANITIYITEDARVLVGRVNLLKIDSTQAEKLKRRFDTREEEPFEPKHFADDMDDAVTQLEKQGYPFNRFELASIALDSLALGKSGLLIDYDAILGPKLRIEEIQIEGNKLTKDNVILREIRIRKGDVYDYGKVQKIPQRLMKLGFFERVERPQVYLAEGDQGGLLIRVKEGNSSRFDGVVGYNPATETQAGYLTGLVDISIGNLLGTGRTVQAHWQKRDRKTQNLMFYYREPWVAGFPVHAGVGFEQLIQDTTYVQRDLALDFSLPLFESFNAFAKLSRLEITPDSVGSYTLGIPRSRTVNATLGIEYDSRDDFLNPQHGAYYSTSLVAGKKTNLGPSSLIRQLGLRQRIANKQFYLDVEFYLPLFKRQVLATALHGRQIKSNEKIIPLPDQFRLGGARSLRGYREDQFRGSNVAWTNLEWRYILSRRSRAFVFLDAGYHSSQGENGFNESYNIGYGFGVRLETGLGIMGIDYGLGKGDGIFNGKVHVGLVNEF